MILQITVTATYDIPDDGEIVVHPTTGYEFLKIGDQYIDFSIDIMRAEDDPLVGWISDSEAIELMGSDFRTQSTQLAIVDDDGFDELFKLPSAARKLIS